jgi:hypothetical protein
MAICNLTEGLEAGMGSDVLQKTTAAQSLDYSQ